MLNPLQPFTYLLLYIALLYLRPHEYVESLATLPLLPVALIAAFGLWLLRTRKNFEAPQHLLMPGLLLALAVSVAANGWPGGGLKVFIDFAPVVLLFFMVATTVDSLERLRQIYFVIAIACAVIAVHGAEQAWFGISWSGAAMIQGRITYLGFLNDPNDLAMAFLMALPMALYLTHERGFLMRWFYRGVAALILYGVYLTNSRGAVVALAAMISLYGVRRFGIVKSLLASPLLLLPLALLAPSRMADISDDEASAAGRVDAWFEGFQMFKSHPVFGVGKGQFIDHHPLTAHNSYVLAFAELGLFGYFFWLSLIALSVWVMLRVVRAQLPTAQPAQDESSAWVEHQRAAWSVLYGFAGVLVAILFLSRSYVVILYLQLATAVAVYQMVRQRWPAFLPVRLGPMLAPLVALMLGSILFFWMLTRVLLLT